MRPVFALVGILASSLALGQLEMASLYDKSEVMIPMRDGVKLFTAIYTPKDKSKASPILFTRTPYSCSPYGPGAFRNQRESYMREGFTFVFQDVRGRHHSEGEFVDVRPQLPVKTSPKDIDESTDTYDAIDWLVKNVPNNNGNVGLVGVSYPGFYAAVGAIDTHPALKCSSPQAPVSEWFLGDDFHHNGAFFLMDCFNFYNGFGRRRLPNYDYAPGFSITSQDAYKFFLELGPIRNVESKYFKGEVKFWTDLMKHPNYDAWWQARSVPAHAKNIRCPIMTVGGWFDAEDLYGALHVYRGIEKLNPGIENGIVMGPWTHGGWGGSGGDRLGDLDFGSKTSPDYQNEVELPFFRKYLKGEGDFKLSEARIFETGANKWHEFRAWPPKDAERQLLYCQPNGKLGFSKPVLKSGFDEYVSDPAHPVPYVDGTRYGRPSEYMCADQRFASRRPDVLTYRTEPLKAPLRLAGPVLPKLFVALTGSDADFVVKVIDEFPEDAPGRTASGEPMSGYQMMIRGEIMRGRYRESFSNPSAFVPGRVTPVSFSVPDICHTFQPGHRVMIQVQSSWFPLADRNPQSFVNIYSAREPDFKKQTVRLHHSAAFPSGVEVGVLGR